MRLGEVLGMGISDFVMGRGGTAYVEIVPRPGNANGARVKMMRPRRVYVGADLERLFADYLTHLACRAAGLGMAVTAGLAAAGQPGPPAAAGGAAAREPSATRSRRCGGRASARRDGRRTGSGTPTPRPCCWPGPRSGWCPGGWVTPTSRPRWTFTAGSGKTRRCRPRRTGGLMRLAGR